ncbi:glycosyltransferase family 2 protein [Hoeflea poritis]|uniref:Glycosyltransferase family 2 protein n=1 Tax=Hoeflea poritis TaxID=2993659 RepID=A0ABT4VN99_9HYPH|nr:glycosyltransferase family 2 protein [Hoeflea poritis]MDA4846166.1 glycosyltransferase family 2 protein [Hoeflea poritis]
MSAVSVIIPAHNAARTIGDVLASLAPDRDLIGEIILIDDRCSDGTAERAHSAAGALKLPLTVRCVQAGSAGAARNAGLEQASCPLLYFIDADDILLAGGLAKLAGALEYGAGLAIGTSVRVTPGQEDLVRVPAGYGGNVTDNADLYLLNGAPPISMGSGLVRAEALADIRFPETITIDEDTWFWSALLATTSVAVTADPVLHYHLDGRRTAGRYLIQPKRNWLAICHAFRRLRRYGVSADVLKWRRAWIAQRFARQLIKNGQHGEAISMLRPVRAHPVLRREWRTTRYRFLSRTGRILHPVPWRQSDFGTGR